MTINRAQIQWQLRSVSSSSFELRYPGNAGVTSFSVCDPNQRPRRLVTVRYHRVLPKPPSLSPSPTSPPTVTTSIAATLGSSHPPVPLLSLSLVRPLRRSPSQFRRPLNGLWPLSRRRSRRGRRYNESQIEQVPKAKRDYSERVQNARYSQNLWYSSFFDRL
jgi:hypothetical protein